MKNLSHILLSTSLSAAVALALLGWSAIALAQEEAPPQPPAETESADAKAAGSETETKETTEGDAAAAEKPQFTAGEENAYTINTLIMFICAILVIFMQAGFAMLEIGLNAAKNTVNILSKNIMDLAVGVLLFFFIGFGLMYPGAEYEGGFWGFGGSGVAGLGSAAYSDTGNVQSDTNYSPSADFLFQVAFAATAATIVSGAVAGRMKFGAYMVYSALLTGLIYPISGMWKWGGGWLAELGFADFAGSVVVHAVGGFAGLAGAIVLGPRIGRFENGKSKPIPGHNLGFAALGVFILWVGWYGFNPGSQLTYSGVSNVNATAYIAVTTTLAAAAGSVVALYVAWLMFGKPDVTMGLNGALAGLVGITANCDQVALWASLVIGAVAGVLVVLGVVMLDKLKIDDPVGAFPVHGLCGIWGGLATGLRHRCGNLVRRPVARYRGHMCLGLCDDARRLLGAQGGRFPPRKCRGRTGRPGYQRAWHACLPGFLRGRRLFPLTGQVGVGRGVRPATRYECLRLRHLTDY